MAAVAAFAVPLNGEVGVVEENTSKVFVGGEPSLAAGALLTASGAGSSLFVINLCASMAPAPNVGKSLPGLDAYRLYQVARREDGRTRYRLRLGFFTTEADAEAVLSSVRDAYPTAFTACLCDEDRKFARGFVPDTALAAPAPKPVASAPKIVVVENKPVAKVEPIKPAPAPVKAATDTVTVRALSSTSKNTAPKPAAPVAPSKMAVTDESLDSTAKHKRIAAPKAAAPAKAATKPASPAPAALTAVDEIELSWDPPALQSAPNAAPIAPAFKTQDVIKAPPAPAATAKTPAAPPKAAAKVAAPSPATKKETIAAPSSLLAGIELTLESEPTHAPSKASSAAAESNEPFRVNKGVEIPKTSLSLEAETPKAAAPTLAPKAAPAAKAAPPAKAAAAPTVAASKPAAAVSKMQLAQAAAPAAIKTAAMPPSVRKVDGPPPDLDSTQTIRALTNDELKDDSQEKWFAIQLAISDQPVNLDAMPRLDIFEAYRLYSVASAGSGKITHALRLGFFREENSAAAVSGYLQTFFNSPSVVRISIAEQARFKDAPAPKPAAASGAGKVLDLSHARSSKTVPTVTMEVPTKKFDPMATGSFRANATGTHKALATGAHPALSATGTHKALKAASKSATPPTKRSAPVGTSASGKHKTLQSKKSLSEQLMDEARDVQLSQSAIRKMPKDESLFSKMFGKKK